MRNLSASKIIDVVIVVIVAVATITVIGGWILAVLRLFFFKG